MTLIPPHLRITTVVVTPVLEEPDRRYRMLVTLQRSDRPKIWTFHCPNCRRPLAELINSEAVALTDAFDPANLGTVANGLRCDTRNCKMWVYFNLNS